MTVKKLRAVSPDETAPKPRDVAAAAAGGDHRELLVAMRDRIARAVANPDCPPRDLASLTRRLQDIAKEISAIDIQAKEEARESGAINDEAWDSEAL